MQAQCLSVLRRSVISLGLLVSLAAGPAWAQTPALKAGGDISGPHRRLDRDGARAAHRIHQRHLAIPSGKTQHRCSQCLL